MSEWLFFRPLIFSVKISVGALTNYDLDLIGLKLGAGTMVGCKSSCQDAASVVRLNQLKKYALYEICQSPTKHERSMHFIQQASSNHSHMFILAHFSTPKYLLSYSHISMNKSEAIWIQCFAKGHLGYPRNHHQEFLIAKRRLVLASILSTLCKGRRNLFE